MTMRCPACGNTKEFQYFFIGSFLINVTLDDTGDLEDSRTKETEVGDIKEIFCRECDFISLPEVFGMEGHEEWRSVKLGSGDHITLEAEEIVDYWHTAVVGNVHLGGVVYDTYAKLYKIHTATSIEELPEMLVADHPAVRNSAAEKMEELTL